MKVEKAIRFYSFLLKLYPQDHRHTFGSQMLQTFKDHYIDVIELDEKSRASFWFAVVSDEIKGIAREQITSLKGEKHMKETWLKQGILFGFILGVIHIVYNIINNLAPANTTLNNFLNIGILIGVLAFTGVAGYYTAHKAGSLKAGIYAGLLTGMLSIFIGTSALFVVTFVFMDVIRHNAFMIFDFQRSGLKNIDEFIIQDALGATFVGTLFSLTAGGMSGTVGSYLGIIVKDR